MSELLHVSSNPHVRDRITTKSVMGSVLVALLPACAFGVYNFGARALLHMILTVAAAVLTEYIYEKLMKMTITVKDLSAAVTGLLLAMNLPVAVPLWIGPLGAVFAIIVIKMLFGGLGQNFMNPALGARCFLLLSFTSIMTDFRCDLLDAATGATPLAIIKGGGAVNVLNMVTGRIAGTIGETSMIAIVIGGCFLVATGIISLRIPLSYIITFVVFIGIFGGVAGFEVNTQFIIAEIAGGGLMLGAFFMATDYVTSPITRKGQYVFGIVLGLLTGIFRMFGPSAEGVSYAIIIGNLLVPLIEKVTLPKAFGKGGEAA